MSVGSAIIELAKRISNEDKAVLDEVTFCVTDIKKYFNENIEQYDNRFIEQFEDEEEHTLCWLGMVDILEKNGYVCERDWKDEKEDFIYFVSELKGMSENGLILDENWLDEDDDITAWGEIIDEKWENDGFCLASIDIESDSFVLFPARVSDLETLDKLAKEAGFRIDHASEM
ncbi:MAG: hypothetical protein HFJ03_13790 [Lachnospira sp.]|nr:hypothetical protein [Lachnospira sp.]